FLRPCWRWLPTWRWGLSRIGCECLNDSGNSHGAPYTLFFLPSIACTRRETDCRLTPGTADRLPSLTQRQDRRRVKELHRASRPRRANGPAHRSSTTRAGGAPVLSRGQL